MAVEKLDRRVRRTRRLVREALRDLILEKGYDAITVQDILDHADVGRSTFYAHFRNKDYVLVSGFEVLYAELGEALIASGSERAPTVSDIALAWFRHADGNRPAFRAILGGGSREIVIRTAREYLAGHVREEIGAMAAGLREPAIVEAVVEFQISALLSLTSWWLDTNSTLSPEEMRRLFVTLTGPGTKAVLEERRPRSVKI